MLYDTALNTCRGTHQRLNQRTVMLSRRIILHFLANFKEEGFSCPESSREKIYLLNSVGFVLSGI